MALFGAELWVEGGFATEMALFGAELWVEGSSATKMALFDAELRRMRGSATEMALFGAEMGAGSYGRGNCSNCRSGGACTLPNCREN